jgi:hypothetical protein
MKSTQFVLRSFAMSLLFAGTLAQAASVTGTVTDKTTGKPAAGDSVALVDVQASMREVARTTADARGRYSLQEPGNGSYLVRVTHQGVGYFIGAPQEGAQGDIPVYDAAAKVDGVAIDEHVLGLETDNGQLRVVERYTVRNASAPPRTQWSKRSFAVVLPAEAVVSDVSAQRPSGLPTSVKLEPDGPQGHYSFNFPIEPNDGDKNTLFQIVYEVPYRGGKFTFHPQVSLPASTVWVVLPKSMTFASGAGSAFQPSPQDPGFQTFVTKNVLPGRMLEFTASGTGSLPSETQGDNGSQGAAGGQPGGGMASPINTPDPLSKYKGWILGGLALLLAAAAAFLLRRPAASAADAGFAAQPAVASAQARHAAALDALKEELFALEREKLSGTIGPEEYANAKTALETVLKRVLKHSS